MPTDAGPSRESVNTSPVDVSVVDSPERYYVVVEKDTAHPDSIFEAAVRQESVDGYNCVLVKDQAAVETALAQRASPPSATSLTRRRTGIA